MKGRGEGKEEKKEDEGERMVITRRNRMRGVMTTKMMITDPCISQNVTCTCFNNLSQHSLHYLNMINGHDNIQFSTIKITSVYTQKHIVKLRTIKNVSYCSSNNKVLSHRNLKVKPKKCIHSLNLPYKYLRKLTLKLQFGTTALFN